MASGSPVDPGVLLAGALLLVGVIASGFAARSRIPSLLLFLGLGMLVADEVSPSSASTTPDSHRTSPRSRSW